MPRRRGRGLNSKGAVVVTKTPVTNRVRSRARRVGAAGASLAGVVLVWQIAATLVVGNTQLFPTPGMVWEAAAGLYREGVLTTDVVDSLRRVAVGFAAGSALGVVVGLLTGRSTVARTVLAPVLTVLRPIPAIALVPVAIVWFGIGDDSKYFVIAYAVALSVWLNTHAGASAVPRTYLRAGQTLGITGFRSFLEIVIPAAAPFIVAGLRLGAAVAFLSLVAAELTGASSGIGFRLQEARQFLATDRMFVGLILLGVLGALLDLTIAAAGQRIVHWENR